jgi:DNA polymerase III epsilon subunit-like protein
MTDQNTTIQWFTNLLQQEVQVAIKEVTHTLSNDLQTMIEQDLVNTTIENEPLIPTYFIKHYVNKFCQTITERLATASDKPALSNIDNCFSNTTYAANHYVSFVHYIDNIVPSDHLLNTSNQKLLESAFGNFTRLAFVDLETDGLRTDQANILQIAISIPWFKQQRFEVFNTFTKPYEGYEIDINSAAYKTNKITQNDINKAPIFAKIAQEIAHVLGGVTIVGFNIHNFDIPILKRHLAANKIETSWTFTIDLAQVYWKNHSLNLSSALKEYQLDPIVDAHNALSDASACVRLMAAMVNCQQLPQSNKEIMNFIDGPQSNGRYPNSKIITINYDAQHPLVPFWHPMHPKKKSFKHKQEPIDEPQKYKYQKKLS